MAMKIKVFEIEFFYDDAVEWRRVNLQITALSKVSLMKVFLQEIQWINTNPGETKREAIRNIWNKEKSFIEEREMEFPIIVKQ